MDTSLPPHLEERLRWQSSPEEAGNKPGQFVLYWMHNALRAHENPALDAAICLARQNGLPLLVYHGLSEDYPFASDRFHAFMLQGHRDVQRELDDLGIPATFQLQRQGHRGAYLRNLTRAAAALVTEEMPVQPLTSWIERLTVTCDTPIALVDCTCLAPVNLIAESYSDPREFSQRVRPIQLERIREQYPEQRHDFLQPDLEQLRFQFGLESLSLQDADLAQLIGSCRIDHTVAPVADTPGGSRAGYARWKQFCQHDLCHYDPGHSANEHNDSQHSDTQRGESICLNRSSRMSAYLHYGMVSPFRLAREAAEFNATEFLEQLLVWRELAFHFCHHHRDCIDSLDALPEWAQETLHSHGIDPREENCSWETLSRGKSGRPLWDTAQRSLIQHGELHRELRTTWGKALLPWLDSPARALQLATELNHRYALDGRNPSSYAGVLWCFGQFDRPDSTDKPVLGCIRSINLDEQTNRIDLAELRKIIDRPIAAQVPRVAVIGAGIAGLSAARALVDHRLDVSVFEKSSLPGGRLSSLTVQSDHSHEPSHIDHGAQYFTARDKRFCRFVNSWIHDDLVQAWQGQIVQLSADGNVVDSKRSATRFVGLPSMRRVAQHLADDIDLHLNHPVTQLNHQDGQWYLTVNEDQPHGPYDVVLLSLPARQSQDLIRSQNLGRGCTDLEDQLASVQFLPCWAVTLRDPNLAKLPFDAAFVDNHPISWICCDSRKPGHDASPTIVLHASGTWSQQHQNLTPDEVIDRLTREFTALTGIQISRGTFRAAHFWNDALPTTPIDQDHLFDRTTGLGLCGDWCGGSRIESAFLSGAALAGAVMRHYTIDRSAT